MFHCRAFAHKYLIVSKKSELINAEMINAEHQTNGDKCIDNQTGGARNASDGKNIATCSVTNSLSTDPCTVETSGISTR